MGVHRNLCSEGGDKFMGFKTPERPPKTLKRPSKTHAQGMSDTNQVGRFNVKSKFFKFISKSHKLLENANAKTNKFQLGWNSPTL